MNGYWVFLLYIAPILLAAGGWLIAYLYIRHDKKHQASHGD